MALEEVYMENVIDYYKKDCYEKKLFFELVEYQKRFFKKNIKIQLTLKNYIYIKNKKIVSWLLPIIFLGLNLLIIVHAV